MTNPATIAEAIARTAEELARCRSLVGRIEDAVQHLADAGPPACNRPQDRQMAGLQAIDLLDQRLDDLARWLGAIAPLTGAVPLPQPARDALAALRLEELRHALGGCARAGGESAGPAELF